jgi:uncharacterized protein (TIGR02001 family)
LRGAEQSLVSGDIGIFSQYESRGLTYSHEQAVPQARLQVGANDGPYFGTFASMVSHLDYNDSRVEFDPYGGYKVTKGSVSLDIGVWTWIYFTGRLSASRNRYNTTESYIGVSYKNLNIRYSYDVSNYFGLDTRSAAADYGVTPSGSSQGSSYSEADWTLPVVSKLNLILHVGHEDIRHYSPLSYNDWHVALELTPTDRLTVSVYWVDTDANASLYRDKAGLDTARSKWVGFVRWAF